MKLATTTEDFGRFCTSDEARIRELHRAGFRYIDLSMYRFTPECEYMQDHWRDAVMKIKNLAEELGMQFVQAHSQGGNPFSDDPAHVDFLLNATIRSIEICEILGIKNTVVHGGPQEGLEREAWLIKNKAFFEKLFPAMERCGVNVLCENSTQANRRYYSITGQDLRQIVEFIDHPQIHVCWDTGHANCEGNQYDDILALGKELYAIHYNDNHGAADDHVAPFLGNMNHDEVIRALIDAGYRGYFTLECTSSLKPEKKRRTFPKQDALLKLSAPQLFMQRHMEAMLYDTAKWMLQEYDVFEE